MKTLSIILVLAVALFVGVSPVLAGKGSGWVGVTTATLDGASGVVLFNIACGIEFRNTRMCNVKEVVETVISATPPVFPAPAFAAWVQTSIEDVNGKLSGSDNCNWTSNQSSDSGTTIFAGTEAQGVNYGQILAASCDELLSVACCTPPRK